MLPKDIRKQFKKRFKKSNLAGKLYRYKIKLARQSKLYGPKSAASKNCGQESVEMALEKFGSSIPHAVAQMDLLAIKIENDLNAGLFENEHWLMEEICPYLKQIHDQIIQFIKLTTYRCRKSGFTKPDTVRITIL